jgi:hypothetical protein
MAMVTGLVLLFAFTAAGVIWLARDVNRSVSHRAVAQSIAFQAARSGAQQIGVASLRESAGVVVDDRAARHAATVTAADLLAGYGLEGHIVRVTVRPPDTVEVEVSISDPAGDVIGVAAARAEAGV